MERTPFEHSHDKVAYKRWLESMTDASDEDRVHALKMITFAIQNELTELQRLYMLNYYVDKMTVEQIAETYKVDTSTVSRTLKRARANLHHVLKYCHPRFLISQPMAVRECSYNRRNAK